MNAALQNAGRPGDCEMTAASEEGYNSLVKKASISEAKNALSALLDRVRNGHSITIEDRGVPVARLEPIIGLRGDQSGRAARLERQGIVHPPAAAFDKSLLRARPPAARRGRRASDVLIAERRDER